MLFFHYLFSLLALVGLVAAKTPPEKRRSWTIIHQLDILRNETRQLNTELDAWNKTMLDAADISMQTDELLRVTKYSTIIISSKSKKLGISGALHVKRDTKHFIKDIRATVGHIGSLREDFKKVGLAQTVLTSLIYQQAASKEMNDAVLPKLPRIGRHAGRRLGRKMDKIFQDTIDEYNKMLAVDPKPALQAPQTGQCSQE